MDVHFAITALATAFTILDPVGMVPTTLALTSTMSPAARKHVVNRAILVAAAVIVFMALVGRYLLQYLGITLPAFAIAGGVLLMLIAIDMLFARPSRAKRDPETELDVADTEGVAVFPLAIPMISGPGTIATVLLLVNLADGNGQHIFLVYFAYGVALLVTWLCMRGADYVLHVLGKTGVNVLTRLLGIILAALAVQFILNGLKGAGFGHA